MFKPVSGDALNNFDPETIELFRKRDSDEQTTVALMQAPRRARHHLPIYIDKEKNPTISLWESQHSQIWWKLLLGCGFFCKSFLSHETIYRFCRKRVQQDLLPLRYHLAPFHPHLLGYLHQTARSHLPVLPNGLVRSSPILLTILTGITRESTPGPSALI